MCSVIAVVVVFVLDVVLHLTVDLNIIQSFFFFFFSSRRRHTRSLCDWSSDVCSSDLTRAKPISASIRWFASQTPVTANHLMEAEIGLARVEIQRKEFSSATHRLLQSQNAIRQISNRYLQVDFFQTLAEAYLSLNRPQEADSALCSALGLTESALTTLQSDNDRLQWDHAAGRTYRTFVESRLQQHDVLGALEFWEWYRA